VSLSEFLEYVSHGQRNGDKQELFRKRTERVQRCLNLAFRKFSSAQAAVNKLFSHIDQGCDGKVSMHELTCFVREDLELSHWDISEAELKVFYIGMDKDGDGVEAHELLEFIQGQHLEMSKRQNVFGAENVAGSGGAATALRRKQHSQSRGRTVSSPSPQFLNMGRMKPSAHRLEASGEAWSGLGRQTPNP